MVNRYDGNGFTNLGIQSKYDHWITYFSKYEGNPFVVGDHSNGGIKTEMLVNGGTVNQAWMELDDYPFGSQ